MLPWLRDLIYDRQSFANFIRAALFLAGELPTVVNFGELGPTAYWVGKALQASALLVRAGDRNAPPP